MLVYFTDTHSGEVILRQLQHVYPATQFLGCTSCQGIMTDDEGYLSSEGHALAVQYCAMAQAYGTAMAGSNQQIEHTTRQVLRHATAAVTASYRR